MYFKDILILIFFFIWNEFDKKKSIFENKLTRILIIMKKIFNLKKKKKKIISYGDIYPQNLIEKILVCILLIFSGIIFAYVINRIGLIMEDMKRE